MKLEHFTFGRALQCFCHSRDRALDKSRPLVSRRYDAKDARDWVESMRWWAHWEHEKYMKRKAQLGEV